MYDQFRLIGFRVVIDVDDKFVVVVSGRYPASVINESHNYLYRKVIKDNLIE